MSKLPTGVEIRGKYIRIWFMFRGKRCRETLKGWEVTNSNIKKAGNLRALIVHEINSGEFEYLRRFPQSSTGAKMVTTRVIKTFGELCDIWTKIKETELTTNTMKKTKSQLKTLRIIICESTRTTISPNYTKLFFILYFFKESSNTSFLSCSIKSSFDLISKLSAIPRFLFAINSSFDLVK